LVDGRPVALNSRLETGQQVEILTAEQGVPQRSWLEPQRGFVHTSRARQKIHEWFRSRDVDVNLDEGRALVAEVLGDLGVAAPPSLIWQNAARELAFPGVPDMLAAVGAADLPVVDVIDLLFAEKLESPQLSLIPEPELAAPTTCRLEVRSPDRDGLLLDIVTLLTEKEVPLLANWGRVDRESGCAIITLQIPFPGLRSLAGILDQLKCVKGVTQARRMP
jgi:GTP pyrophosphokinase